MLYKYRTIVLVAMVSFLLLVSFLSIPYAKQFKDGIEAPSWGKTQWINLPKGKKNLDVKDFRGKVVYLAFFQQW